MAAGWIVVMEDPVLQWGRNLIVAEGQLDLGALGGLGPASMGPQLDSCGRHLPARGGAALQKRFNGAAT